MKAVMLSVRPKWCELIANGKKTVEVRKSRPKLETPFKCYIYCTKASAKHFFVEWSCLTSRPRQSDMGKVIGEFICDDITRIQSRGIDDNYDYCYESLNCFGNDDIETEIIAIRKSCIKKADLNEYGKGTNALYGWHISGLKIYDEPKELCEFEKCNASRPCENGYCKFETFDYSENCKCCSVDFDGEHCPEIKLQRPPQSWGYVEELVVI